MDIRKDGWFGRLTLNGKTVMLDDSNNIVSTGSLMRIISDALKSLQSERARTGVTTIQLTLTNNHTELSDTRIAEQSRALEVDALIEVDGIADTPGDGELYHEFYDRLIKAGYTIAAAEMVSGEWFNMPVSSQTTQWLNDPKAVRFRELNSRDEAFESALPQEYEQLKKYVRELFPEFIEHLTFRTAN